MPLYDFECKECNYVFEEIRSIAQCTAGAPNPSCPKCGSGQVFRKLSAVKSYSINGKNDASTTPKKHRT